MNNIKVTIICLTFNHANFIRQALDGFVMQKANFPFEVLIHDDASTDGTADIIREYEEKFPDIIKPICQKENQFSRIGLQLLTQYIFPRVQGEYVAMCEGDDYWTDPLKLQKQVDFLDAHPDFTICFHPVKVLWEDQPEREEIFPASSSQKTFTAEDLIKGNFIQTNSVLYRWVFPEKESLDIWPDNILPGDWFLHLIHAKHGKIGMLDDVMAVYRRHPGGIWQGARTLKYGDKENHFYDAVDRLFDYKYHDIVEEVREVFLIQLFKAALHYDNYDMLVKVGRLSKIFPVQIFRYITVPSSKWSWKHIFVNKLAKMLGLGFVYHNENWFFKK